MPLTSAILLFVVILDHCEFELHHVDKLMHVRYDKKMWVYGKLNKHGTFVPDFNYRPIEGDTLISSPGIINKMRVVNERVYEYRSGMLIPGIISDDLEFVPEANGKIISMSEYRPISSRRIYNLPGILWLVRVRTDFKTSAY